VTDYEQFIQHVVDGVTAQIDIAEMMGKHRGCISKWATRALSEGRISGSPRRPLPPAKCAKTRVHANDDDDDDSLADFRDDDDDAR
jgi:transposase